MATVIEQVTAEAILARPPKQRHELIRGEVRLMSPASFRHGMIISNVSTPLDQFVRQHGLGVVVGAETGFFIERDPDTVRGPDVAFVRKARVPQAESTGFFDGSPDIAVEVLSPGDTASEVDEKTEDWLRSGCCEVWIVDPRRKRLTKWTWRQGRALGEVVDVLTSDLLPDFKLTATEVFA